MPLSISSPKLTLLARLRADWVNGNTLNQAPTFHTGWLNPGGAQYQACFPNLTEATPFETGFEAMAQDGPVSRRVGTLPVTFFARREEVGSAGAINPKQWVELAAREAERIVHVVTLTLDTDLEYISVVASNELPPDTKHEPPFFGWTVICQYEWRKTRT